MADGALRLHGRDEAVSLVREFATRPEPNGYPVTRRAPVLVFTGPKGCGKTALLDSLEQGLRGNVPYARIDCGELKATTAWEVLSLLAFDLNRNAAGYRSIPFPRFVTAQVAIAARIDTPGQAARLRIRQELENARRVDQLRTFLDTLAEDVVGAVPVVGDVPGVTTAARFAPNLILDGLVSRRWGRRVVLGQGLEWYGSGNQAYDELVRLSMLTRDDASEADRKEATELLWAAFLADLRAAFATGRGARTWSLNCVLLLDDIDSKPGRLLYRALADARRGESDPLTVVTTSAGEVARQLAADQEIPFAAEAGYDDYVERRQGDYESDSYPVALRDLTPDEVKDMVADVAGPRLNARRAVAGEVYRFTAGHPAATAVIVKAIGDNTGEPRSVQRLLSSRWRGPVDKDPVTVEERLLRELLGSPDGATLAALEACSAARDVEQAVELARSGLVPAPRGGAGLVPVVVQVRDPDTGRAVMLPALRHVLLRRLAATPERWTAVHTWLRDHGREADRHYHALALRDVDAVVHRLESLLSDTRAWFAELDAITAAPNDLDTDESDPGRVLAAIGHTTTEEPGRTLARVVAALWSAADPLSTADRADLYASAAWDLKTLAQQPGVARNDFLRAATKLEARAEEGGTPTRGRAARRQLLSGPPKPRGFVPPTPKRAVRRKRRRLAALGVVVALVLGSATVAAVTLFTRCGEGVYEHGGECVGVTDGSYVFDDQLADVQRRILEENRKVEGQPHVTIAVLTPLLPTEVGSVTWQRVRAQLEGAHVAQLAANEGGLEPKVRLLLANPGSRQQEWRRVVDQLIELADEQRLVGVVGVGQSTTNTQHTARALSAADLPMVASVVTATDFHLEQPAGDGEPARYLKGFTRVSSTTGNQIGVLASYLADQGVTRAMLIYDINEDDLYTSTLYDEFKAAAARGALSIPIESRFDTEASLANQFSEILKDLCVTGAPNTLLYAGRAVLLDELIDKLRGRGCALEQNITLVTGSDASMLRARRDLWPRDDEPDLTIVYTPHVDPDAAGAMGITEFAQLTEKFEGLGFDTADLADGWGVMMHDALLAASDAVRRAANGLAQGELPNRQAVRAALERSDRERNQIRGAGGAFTIDATTGNAVGRRLPVIELGPTGAFQVKAIIPVG